MSAATSFVRDNPHLVAVDTETTGLEWNDVPFCVTLAWEGESHYLDLEIQFEEAEYILGQVPVLCMHNAKFDLHKLIKVGLLKRERVTVESFEDTQLMAHIYNEYLPLGLKALAESLLGESTDEALAIKAAKKEHKLKASDGYDKLPREVVKPYAIKDAEFTFKLYQYLDRKGIHREIYDLEKEFCLAILDIEARGLKVDQDTLKRSLAFERTNRLRYELALREWTSDDFNPNSPKQVLETLHSLGYADIDSTGIQELGRIEHPFVGNLLSYRKSQKIVSTYLENIENIMDDDGIVHPWFRLSQTRTGRISSGKVEDG